MASLKNGITTSGKNITFDTSMTQMPTRQQINDLEAKGYTVNINAGENNSQSRNGGGTGTAQENASMTTSKGTSTITTPAPVNNPQVPNKPSQPANNGFVQPTNPVTTPTVPAKVPPLITSGADWNVVGKQADPTSVSTYLNGQPGFNTKVEGNTVTGTKNGVKTTWVWDNANWVVKPPIATAENPVIGVEATPTTPLPTSYLQMTPEQLSGKYDEISAKLPSEWTDDDRRFSSYIQGQISRGKTLDTIFGTKDTKSSGTTTYSPDLTQPGENIASTVRNDDGSYTVTYKDGTTQQTASKPSTTVFPEGTPEFYAQKQAEAGEEQVAKLKAQMTADGERRKKETADLVAQYGTNIAQQFQSQKAEIEDGGNKRTEALNSSLSFSGFGRSTVALEKRDEIAKDITDTVNQAKSKADLELMVYRMERENADEEAIASVRSSIASVQQKIEESNYNTQLKVIELNAMNEQSGTAAMNTFLGVISNSKQIQEDADLDKSAKLGYFIDKKGKVMLDSQGRPMQFEGNVGGLDPAGIQSYADAVKSGIIDQTGLNKLSPEDRAAVLKNISVGNGTYTPVTDISTATGDVTSTDIAKQYANKEAWATTNNPSGITVNNGFSKKLDAAGITYTKKPRPESEGGEYYVFSDISDGLKAHQIALKQSGWTDVYDRLYSWSAGGDQYTSDAVKKANKEAYATNLMAEVGIPRGTKISDLTPAQDAALLSAHLKKESPNLYKALTSGASGGNPNVDLASLGISQAAQDIIKQINNNGGKASDYMVGTGADSQALLAEVNKGLNAQGGTGTLATDTRTQSLQLATDTITSLLSSKNLAGSIGVRNQSISGILGANKYTEFTNRIDALAGQLLQIDGPTLKAMFGPQISNSDVEAIKRTILQGLSGTDQTPASFEASLKDIQNKMNAYISRLPKSTGSTPPPANNPNTPPPAATNQNTQLYSLLNF